MTPVEGFDGNQEAQLRSKKQAYTRLPEVQKWREIYKILFPRVQPKDIPSPCQSHESRRERP